MKTISIITRHATDDYEIAYQEISNEQYRQFQTEGSSVRGTLSDVIAEVFEETPRHTVKLTEIRDIKRRLDLYGADPDRHMDLLNLLFNTIDHAVRDGAKQLTGFYRMLDAGKLTLSYEGVSALVDLSDEETANEFKNFLSAAIERLSL